LEQGKTCKFLNFLESGFVRAFYYKDGKEITSWFAFENDIVTSMYSFTAQKPSFENIEIIENSVLHSIHFDQLQQLYQQFPEFNLIGRLITEKYFIELEERIFSLQIKSAKERIPGNIEQSTRTFEKSISRSYRFLFRYFARNIKPNKS